VSSRPNYTLKVRFQMNSCGFMHFGANLPHPQGSFSAETALGRT
jgi:hypothetical protein